MKNMANESYESAKARTGDISTTKPKPKHNKTVEMMDTI